MRVVLSPSGTRLAPTEAERRPVACWVERPELLQKNLKKYKKTIDFTFQRCYYHIQLFEREKQIKKYILYVKK